MNKKIYAGMLAFGIAASFWACGSGDILTPNAGDNVMKLESLDDGPEIISVDVSKINPTDCPRCFEGVSSSVPSSSSKKVRSSSSSVYVPPTEQSSSSSFWINLTSSSVYNPPTPGSSSSRFYPPTQSSSSAGGGEPLNGDVGSCAPNPATVSANGQTKWTFTKGSAITNNAQLINATFDWTFEGATPATVSVKGATGLNQTVSYSTSGSHSASLVITIGASRYPVTCSPVHVNGAAITGCKCTAVNPMPDIAQGELGTWTVSGCTSRGATITGYTWGNGVTGADNIGTYAFTKKKQSLAPVVNVSNDDNTVQAVQCDRITAVDANDPDYVITGGTTGTFTVGPGKYKMVYACKADQYDQRPIVVEAPSGSVSGKIGGKAFSVNVNGRAETYKSTTTNVPIDVEITSGTAKITCG